MPFPNVSTILLQPSKIFDERSPSASESALIVLGVAAATAASLVVSAWAYPGSEITVRLVRTFVVPTVLSFVLAWVLIAGTLVVLIPSRVGDLGGMLATIGWGFAPAVIPAVARTALVVATPTESLPAGSLWAYAGGAGYPPLFALAVAALVWQWYVTFRAVQANYDVAGGHAAVATAVPFGVILAAGALGLSLGLPDWRSVGFKAVFAGLSLLVIPQLLDGTLLQSGRDGSTGRDRGRYRNRTTPWRTLAVRFLGVCIGGAGFVMLGGPVYVAS